MIHGHVILRASAKGQRGCRQCRPESIRRRADHDAAVHVAGSPACTRGGMHPLPRRDATESGRVNGEKMAKKNNRAVTREAAEAAVQTLLRWAGEDPHREGLRDTPKRVVDAYRDWFSGYASDPSDYLRRTFEEVEGYDEMVVLRDIAFESFCEHHMAPIIGRAHVGYLPTDRVVGISKLARVVDGFSRRFQVQEKLTAQIAGMHQRGAQAARRRRRHRRRTSMHDHARGAQARRVDGHQQNGRHVSRRCQHPRGISALHRHRG